MDTLERFNAALTYIEANLDNEIDSKELSNEVLKWILWNALMRL